MPKPPPQYDPREEEMQQGPPGQMPPGASPGPPPGQMPPPQGMPPQGQMPPGGMPPGAPPDMPMDPSMMGQEPPGGMDPSMGPMDPAMMVQDPSQVPLEPYSVQLWRRVHGDKNDLLNEYHNLLQPLEHEPSKALMIRLLQDKAFHLDQIENHWNQHYKHFPPLDGMMIAYNDPAYGHQIDPHTGQPMQPINPQGPTGYVAGEFTPDDKNTTVGSPEDASMSPNPYQQEVPAEEAVEGMKTKDKGGKKKDKKSGTKGQKALSFLSKADDKKKSKEDKAEKKEDDDEEEDTEEGDLGEPSEEAEAEGEEGADEVAQIEMTDENVPTPPEVAEPNDLPETLKDHEISLVVDTGEFLKDVGAPNSPWDEDYRFKSYYFGRSLDNIGNVVASGSLTGDAGTAPGYEEKKKSLDNNGEAKINEARNSHRKMCKDAGAFLMDMSKQAVIGDSYRVKALNWHKQLGTITAPGMPDETGMIDDPGYMGEKSVSLSFLEAANKEQDKVLNSLLYTVEGLTKVLKKA